MSHVDTVDEVEAAIAALNDDERERIEGGRIAINGVLPFRPLFKTTGDCWYFWCPKLSPITGRCTDYANRPVACTDYEPGCDRMCAIFDEEGHEHEWIVHHRMGQPDTEFCLRCGAVRQMEGHEVKEDEDDRFHTPLHAGGGEVQGPVGEGAVPRR